MFFKVGSSLAVYSVMEVDALLALERYIELYVFICA